MKNVIRLLSLITFTGVVLTSCEGPMGPAGADANETCKQCHNTIGVDSVSTQYTFSKHSYGEAAFSESGNTGCSPCHASEAFKYVVKNNVSTVFTLSGGVYSNPYAASSSKAYGEIGCTTCHANLHTTYTDADFFPLTNTAAVPMTMWGGAKTINLVQKGGESNLCIKCHQPRPFTNSNTDKGVLNYAGLASNPTAIFYDAAQANTLNVLKPSYRTHTHYGTAGAVYAGQGGVEFPGTLSYTSSKHTTDVSCQDCHMAPMTGRAGGHTFFAKGNFNGCTPCHPTVTATTQDAAYWANPRADIKSLLNSLAAKLTIGGVDILNRNPVSVENSYVNYDYNFDGTAEDVLAGVNLWAGLTTNNYDGYLNIYDPATNPLGSVYNNNKLFQNPSTSGFNAAQIAFNTSLPKLVLTNAQMGALINFQLVLRDYSLGIHNYKYSKALLTNTIAKL
jgi:hypothetical protein